MVMIVLSRRGCWEQRGTLNELAVQPFLRLDFKARQLNLIKGILNISN